MTFFEAGPFCKLPVLYEDNYFILRVFISAIKILSVCPYGNLYYYTTIFISLCAKSYILKGRLLQVVKSSPELMLGLFVFITPTVNTIYPIKS